MTETMSKTSTRQDRQLRAWLRRQHLAAAICGKMTEAHAWKFAANDDLAFETVAGEMQSRCAITTGSFAGFLAWLLEHREEILQFVLTLVDLFTKNGYAFED